MKDILIVAAAGLSSRMKNFKPVMNLGDSSMIEILMDRYIEAGIHDITVVSGYKGDILKGVLRDRDVTIIENPDYATTTMLDSVRMGLEHIKGAFAHVFITPVDIPLMSPDTIRRMRKSRGDIAVPLYRGQRGHFFSVSPKGARLLRDYSKKGGLRGFLRNNEDKTDFVEVDDQYILVTADTLKEFQQLRKANNLIKGKGKLFPELDIQLTRTDAALNNEKVMFLEMIEKTGAISGACSVMHISYTKGWSMLNAMEEELGVKLIERFSGGSDGGGSRLTPEGKEYVKKFNTFLKRMKEHSEKEFARLFKDI